MNMKTYARINDGRVAEIIAPMTYEVDSPAGVEPAFKKGDEVPIDRRFPAEIVASLVDIRSAIVSVGDSYKDGVFAPYVLSPPSAEDILVGNTAMRDMLLGMATVRIAPLQDAVDLGVATASETSALTAWKQYRVSVNRVDITELAPIWPAEPA